MNYSKLFCIAAHFSISTPCKLLFDEWYFHTSQSPHRVQSRLLAYIVVVEKLQLEVYWIGFVWILLGPRLLILFPFMGGERRRPWLVGEWEKAMVCLDYKRGWKASEVKWCVHTTTPLQWLMIICRAWKNEREREELGCWGRIDGQKNIEREREIPDRVHFVGASLASSLLLMCFAF